MATDMTLGDYGLEPTNHPITHVRIHRTDGQWLVEYRRKPKWIFALDKWWWFNDGKYINYGDANARAKALADQGYVIYWRYKSNQYHVTPVE
jgi:hypothetical protein